jgi:hypothetical protein
MRERWPRSSSSRSMSRWRQPPWLLKDYLVSLVSFPKSVRFTATWCEAGGGGAPARGQPHLGLSLEKQTLAVKDAERCARRRAPDGRRS